MKTIQYLHNVISNTTPNDTLTVTVSLDLIRACAHDLAAFEAREKIADSALLELREELVKANAAYVDLHEKHLGLMETNFKLAEKKNGKKKASEEPE